MGAQSPHKFKVMTEKNIGKLVKVKCPVFRQNKTLYGTIKSCNILANGSIQYLIILDGNKKSTKIHESHVTLFHS